VHLASGSLGVFLGQAIDEHVANLVVGQLLHLDAEHSDRPVSMYINSPGGEMNAFFAILDTM
jgi:ATP-dependent Clp protease, protease subunit